MDHESQVLKAFSTIGYESDSRVTKQVFKSILDELQRSKFNDDVAEELWDQVPVSIHKQAFIRDLARIIIQGQRILVEKIRETRQQLNKNRDQMVRLQMQRKINQTEKRLGQTQTENRIKQLETDQKQYLKDFILLTQPFGIRITPTDPGLKQVLGHLDIDQDGAYSSELRSLFLLTLVFVLLQVLVINVKYDFLNMLVSLALLSMFFLNFFNSFYVRLCIWLVVGSVAFDFMWLMVMTGAFWTGVGVVSGGSAGYLRFALLLVICNTVIKTLCGILLLEFKQVKLGSVYKFNPISEIKITLTAKPNPLFQRQQYSLI